MIDKLIMHIARIFNKRVESRIEDLKLEIICIEERLLDYFLNYNNNKYAYFRRGKCKGCLFLNKDEELLKSGQGYCIFNPEPKIVMLNHKCGRIVKR